MKKLVFLSVLICFMGVSSISYSQINKRIDSFDESKRIFSYNKINSIDSLRFRKVIQRDGNVEYDILISSDTYGKNNMYSKKDAEIKINSDIMKMEISNVSFMHYNYSSDVIDSEAHLDLLHIAKLKDAEKVALRFYHENGLSNTIEVPSHVLAEWKQVINTEK